MSFPGATCRMVLTSARIPAASAVHKTEPSITMSYSLSNTVHIPGHNALSVVGEGLEQRQKVGTPRSRSLFKVA